MIPHHLIVIAGVGNGEVYALDCSQTDSRGEAAVVVCHPWAGRSEKLEIVARSFGEFLLNALTAILK
jgi:D-aminopeptidase